MEWSTLGTTFVTLVVIMDPLGAAPIFLALTGSYTPRQRQPYTARSRWWGTPDGVTPGVEP